MLSTQNRPSTSTPGDGSRTITVHDVQPRPEDADGDSAGPSVPEGILRLRGGPRSRPRVAWDEHVVDNEDCGRKKSKICCIYHKPKEFDESSDEESSSDEDSDSIDDGRARRSQPHRHHHHHDQHPSNPGAAGAGGDGMRRGGDRGGIVHELEESPEPNAYESLPKKEKGRG